ncbi:MAG: hypothetical protein QOK06_3019 [Acidimicrobiaceae bacterium]
MMARVRLDEPEVVIRHAYLEKAPLRGLFLFLVHGGHAGPFESGPSLPFCLRAGLKKRLRCPCADYANCVLRNLRNRQVREAPCLVLGIRAE